MGRVRESKACGQSVVEFAFVLPVLLLIFVGVVDLSRLFHVYVAATNAARVGAEAATSYDLPIDRIVTAVQDEASPTLTISNVVISPTVRWPNDSVQVQVTYVFTAYTPLVSGLWGGGGLPLVASATSRVY